MFHPSAATDTLQGRAIHAINEKWGIHNQSNSISSSSPRDHWIGRETIGIPVCKKKYAPFDFRKKVLKDGRVHVQIVRIYGCTCHSHLREGIIKRFGERKGWEPFGQWSMKKAQVLSKKLQQERLNSSVSRKLSDNAENDNGCSSSSTSLDLIKETSIAAWKRLCHNGNCAWKMKHKYDNVVEEIHERIEDGE